MTGPRAAAVVLAAGQSARMGGPNKLLLDLRGQTVLARTLAAVLGAALAEIVVVTGHDADAVCAAVAGLQVRRVHNPDFAQGRAGSVAAGVGALPAGADPVMVVPGDMALLTSADLTALLVAWAGMRHGSILVPFVGGRRGNPVLFAARHAASIASGGMNPGCRRLIADHPDEVTRIDLHSPGYVTDCDTPQDYAALRARYGEAMSPSRP